MYTYQRYHFDTQFFNKFDNEFEAWFGQLARKLHPGGECQQIRLTQGDGKIDIYVINEQIVYQCYGPSTYSPSKASKKILIDFWGAYDFLRGKLKKWIFVHNHPTGCIDKDTIKTVNDLVSDLKEKNIQVKILVWGKENIWDTLQENLNLIQMRDLFGEQTPVELDYRSLESLIYNIQQEDYQPSIEAVEMPDADKLDYNDLGPSYKLYIETGRKEDYKVGLYFSRCPDPEFGERLAEHFRNKYLMLKRTGNLKADEIFDRLQAETGWKTVPDAKSTIASMAIISYFFHRCDIFENVPVER